MAKPKIIEDEALIDMLEPAFQACGCSSKKFTCKYIASYCNLHGYPGLKESVIRNNPEVMQMIRDIRAGMDSRMPEPITVYKTFDVNSFLDTHTSRNDLREGLIQREYYFHDMYKQLLELSEKVRELTAENANLKKKKEKLETSVAESSLVQQEEESQIQQLMEINQRLEADNKVYLNLISTYLYPEIANELLKQAGILQNTANMVDPDRLEENIITGKTEIKSGSNVIRGLFGRFN